MKQIIQTQKAPKAIGAYSQAVKAGNTVYLSGQIGLSPETMELVASDFKAQTHQAFKNLHAVAEAAGGDFKNLVKLNVYLTDLKNFADFNAIMDEYWEKPYPARALIGVASLPKNAVVEIEGIMVLGE